MFFLNSAAVYQLLRLLLLLTAPGECIALRPAASSTCRRCSRRAPIAGRPTPAAAAAS
jgi:hypothetical protein